MKYRVAEVLGLSDFSPEDLLHEIRRPNIIVIYRKLSTEKSQTDGCYLLLRDYVHSPFREFESYIRIVVGLNEDDIRVILKQYNSEFITHKIYSCAYTFKDLSEVLSRCFENEFEIRGGTRPNHKNDKSDSIIIDSDNLSWINKLRLGPQMNVMRFDIKSFLIQSSVLFQIGNIEVMVMSTIVIKIETSISNKIHLKCDCIDGSVLNGVRQSILSSFVLDKPSGYQVFSEPETLH